jgi:hypothetical protein
MAFNVQSCPIDYNVKPTLMASGLRDLDNGIRYTACKTEPAGDIVLGSINMSYKKSGSFTNMFSSSFSFYDKDRSMKSTKQQMVGLGSISTGVSYQTRIDNGEIKYKNSEPTDPAAYLFPYYIYKRNLPAEYYRKLLVTDPTDEIDAENIGNYIVSLIQPPSESARIKLNITNEFWRLQD